MEVFRLRTKRRTRRNIMLGKSKIPGLWSRSLVLLINLRLYKSARSMWEYLKKNLLSKQQCSAAAVRVSIGKFLSGLRSIKIYYSSFTNLWIKYTDIIYVSVSLDSFGGCPNCAWSHQEAQFLMKVRAEFESIRSSLMNHESIPTLDDCLGAFLGIYSAHTKHNVGLLPLGRHWETFGST